MNSKWTTQALPVGLVLSFLLMPVAAAYQEAYVIPRLVAGTIDGAIYTPKLSFRNLSNKQCDGKFQLLEGNFNPAGGVFEFNGIRISDGILPVSLLPGEGLSGRLRRIGAGGFAGFGIWRQDGACAAGQDVVLTADVEVGKVQADNRYVLVARSASRQAVVLRSVGVLRFGRKGPQKAEIPPASQWYRANQAPVA